MIQIKELFKKYNSQIVLDKVSITFPNNGMVFIYGDTGSGKTSFLNLISGIDKPKSGQIIINDIKFDKYNFSKWSNIRKNSLTYITQNYNLNDDDTIYDNLRLSYVETKDFNEQAINEVLIKVNLVETKYKKISELSGGQKQRVAIARGLLSNKKILLLDEPTKGLDLNNSTILYDICKELSKDMLIIVVTHELSYLEKYSDISYELKNGLLREKKIEKIENDSYLKSDITTSNVTNNSIDTVEIRNYILKTKEEKRLSLFNKLLLLLGFLLGFVITTFVAMLIPDNKYINIPKNINSITFKDYDINEYSFYKNYHDKANIFIAPKIDNLTFYVPNNRNINISNFVTYPINFLDNKNIISGHTIQKNDEIVLDIGIFNNVFNKNDFISVGIKNYKKLINKTVIINNKEYTISGVSNRNENIIFVSENTILTSYNFTVTPLSELSNNYTLVSGMFPSDYEQIYAYTNSTKYNIGDIIELGYSSYKFKVTISGKITTTDNEDIIVVRNNDYKDLLMRSHSADFNIIIDDYKKLPILNTSSFKVTNLYNEQMDKIRLDAGINMSYLSSAVLLLVTIYIVLLIYLSISMKDKRLKLFGIKHLLGYSRKHLLLKSLKDSSFFVLINLVGFLLGVLLVFFIDYYTYYSILKANYSILLNINIIICFLMLTFVLSIIPNISIMYKLPIKYLNEQKGNK